MITDREIEEKAREFGINAAEVEKDYVYGWVLNALYTQSALGNLLVLKGGNGLRKAYLPNTRFSKDLDFSSQQSIDEGFLEQELRNLWTGRASDRGPLLDRKNGGEEQRPADRHSGTGGTSLLQGFLRGGEHNPQGTARYHAVRQDLSPHSESATPPPIFGQTLMRRSCAMPKDRGDSRIQANDSSPSTKSY